MSGSLKAEIGHNYNAIVKFTYTDAPLRQNIVNEDFHWSQNCLLEFQKELSTACNFHN